MRAVAGLASVLPQLVKLLARLARDPRVPVRAKRVAAALVVYAALPIDLAPDWIPLVGLADDLLAVVVGVAVLIETAPQEVVIEHWDGPPETLGRILVAAGLVMGVLPARVRWVIRRLVGE